MRQYNQVIFTPQRLLLSLALALSCIAAASGCNSDTALEGVISQDCQNDTDCPSGSRCTVTSKGQRLCLTIETLTADVGEFDGEVFDPNGLTLCGDVNKMLFCVSNEICCDGACVSQNDDERNCGGCGVSCSAGEQCQLGQCLCGSTLCVLSETCCADDGGTFSCRPILDDRENCGACGNICNIDARESCLDGQCGCIKQIDTPLGTRHSLDLCREGQSCCPPPANDPSALLGCVDLNTTDNCGSCGNQCGEGEQCVDGQCTCGTVTHPSPDGVGPVCDTTDTDPGSSVLPREACCFNPNGRQECRPFADCDCGGAQCTGVEICCFNSGFARDACVDPTKDVSNCGGCASEAGSTAENPQFLCSPGEVCARNFNYSLARSPEEQSANGIFIGECKLNCALNHAQCPGGIDPNTSLPYMSEDQSCVNPLLSIEFCGATLRANVTSTTTGLCSEANPQTYGELKSYQGVRCASGERCESKTFCDNPDPPPGTDHSGAPCSARTHYYYDVSVDSSSFFDDEAIPAGGVFFINGLTSQADRDAYLENPFLRAVCAPL